MANKIICDFLSKSILSIKSYTRLVFDIRVLSKNKISSLYVILNPVTLKVNVGKIVFFRFEFGDNRGIEREKILPINLIGVSQPWLRFNQFKTLLFLGIDFHFFIEKLY